MNVFINHPHTLEEFVSNCRFQLECAEGYLQMARDRGDETLAARIKLECLVTAAKEALQAFRLEEVKP